MTLTTKIETFIVSEDMMGINYTFDEAITSLRI